VNQLEFIEKAIRIHGDKYDYSLVKYVNNKTKVKIICSEHGVFVQSPGSHVNQKSKCPSCSSIKLDTDSFIKKSKKLHGDKYDYSKTNYVNSRSKVIITCPKHGDFSILARAHHYLGQGCRACGLESKEVSFEEFVIRSKKHHGEKYSYPNQEFNGITSVVRIICPEHGEFQQKATSHSKGHGCYKCAKIFNSDKHRLSTEEVIKQFQEIHRNRYDYSEVKYFSNSKKLKIICKEHGPFYQNANAHKNGQGCDICGKIKGGKKNRSKWEEIYPELIKVHGNKYTYDKSTYIKSSSKMKVYCKIHEHDFEISPTQLKLGQGCYHCGIDKIKDFLTEDWESTYPLIRKVHGKKYNYNKESFTGRRQKMEIFCKKHGPFLQEVSVHLAGSGCPNCNSSIGENFISLFLENRNIDFEQQKTFEGLKQKRKLKVDFYIDKFDLVIEYNGRQHYEAVGTFGGKKALFNTQRSDNLKRQYCIDNQINFEIIRYDEDTETRMNEILEKYS